MAGERDACLDRGHPTGPADARRARRMIVSSAARPSPSVHRDVRPVPVERSVLDGSASLTGRGLVPNPLRSRDVQYRGSVRSGGCAPRRPPRGSRRRREGWSGFDRRSRRATPRSRRREHRCLFGADGIGPDRGSTVEHVGRRRPVEADIHATAAISSGRCSSSCAPAPGRSATAVARVVQKTLPRTPALPGQWASPAPEIAHDPSVLTIRDTVR